MSVLKIGGEAMPPLKSLTIIREAIWSKNTGRTATGKMVGDIIGYKYKLQITFKPLSDEQAALVASATRPAFLNVEFTDPEDGEKHTIKMYAGSPAFPVYSYVDGVPRYVGTKVDLIEQ